ncbi:ubiquitin-activating E1 FCCH domain-containing protein [Caulobacter hibisci]|uniref:Pilus assembly protein TadG n=1 Tax=Caulobacter hibisci TaxID=2035993 RepID=A0ABS0T3Z2_9CAUL|nr:ubiquitin-activating E1 FCCH domain-containing protein [Caulobacter hibisci]MBI1686384.1 pilus assembly protein TadG [Caulobacter hibisci]
MTVRRRLSARLDAALARLRGLCADTRGAIAVWVALSLIPLSILCFGIADISRATLERRNLQDALDAATLIAARSTATDATSLTAIGLPALTAELGYAPASATFTRVAAVAATSTSAATPETVVGKASTSITPIILNLWTTSKTLAVSAKSEVVRSSKNLEVALVLDTTGSMFGTRLTDLKTAASDAIDTIVQDTQTPFYSKIAIIPYSVGVDVGTYADTVRGPVAVRTVTNIANWTTASGKSISGVTKANPAVVTITGHGYSAGDTLYISGVKGMTQLNGQIVTVASVVDANKIKLNIRTDSGYSTYTSSGTTTKCTNARCTAVVTAASHGYLNGDIVDMASVGGMTQLNGNSYTIGTVATNTFELTGVAGTTLSTYTSGGTATCNTTTSYAFSCTNFTFNSTSNSTTTYKLTTCATDRSGTSGSTDYAYTDDSPSTALVGRHYYSATTCPSEEIMPLSSDKTALKAKITAFTASGSTAGQIGIDWGWYMVSPNFSSLWSSSTQKPAAYGATDLLKVVIIMTDGAFNTGYCRGVMSKDSGQSGTKIDCSATNGDLFDQAKATCTAMKKKNIVIYTVGFDVGSDADAKDMLTKCATDSDKAKFPSTGSELKATFKSIAQDISALRIAK